MLTTEEINRRNEAIALFDGWEKIEVFGGYYWQRGCAQISFLDYMHWNALMPVVEKVKSELQGSDYFNEVAGKLVSMIEFRVGLKVYQYVWRYELEWYIKALEATICDSYRTAYFMAVSDYCLAAQEK